MPDVAANKLEPDLAPRGSEPVVRLVESHPEEPEQEVDQSPSTELCALLRKLSQREYEVAMLAVEGRTYKEIAEELFLSISTVQTHLHNIYGKLGVQDKTELTVALTGNETSLEGMDFSVLSPKELRVFDLLGIGLRNKAIGFRLRIKISTAGTHQSNIDKKLGLKNQGERAKVARVFGKRVADTAITLQPAVVETLDKVRRADTRGEVSLNKPESVHRINNPALLKWLHEKGYISQDMAKRGSLNLGGLVVALLVRQSETKEILDDPQTGFVVEEVLQQEIRIFRNRT